jgi:hypothetical protein
MKTYPSFRYDEKFLLKVSPLLWIIMLFLTKDLWIWPLTLVSRSGELIGIAVREFRTAQLIAEGPAILVLAASFRRSPAAGPWARIIWRNGRWLLSASAALDLLLVFPRLLHKWDVSHALDWGIALASVASALIIVYLWQSTLIRDIFANFPDKQ